MVLYLLCGFTQYGIDARNPDEATHAGFVGLAVDYMTRFMLGAPVEEAFQIFSDGRKTDKRRKEGPKAFDWYWFSIFLFLWYTAFLRRGIK